MKKSREGPLPVPYRYSGYQNDGTVLIEVNGKELRLWNHSPERLAEAVAASDGIIKYQERWHLLFVNSSAGSSYVFCVAKSLHGRVPCPETPPAGRPVELLRSAGGFSIPA
jgi:hypothetical protein